MDNFIKNQLTNLKYWILGNILSFAIFLGYFIFAFIFLLIAGRSISEGEWGLYLFIAIISFFSGLTIKIIKKDLPIHYYGTVGLIIQFLFALFIHLCEVKDFLEHPGQFKEPPGSFKIFFFQNFFFQTIIASILGGFIVDTYQFCENKLKKININMNKNKK
jgi:hypothetical protein